MGWGILFIIIPLIFVAVGLWGVISGIRAIGKSPEAIARRVSVDTGVQLWIQSVVKVPGEYLPIRLVTKTSHIKALGGTIFIALFWNGIVSIFLAIGIFDDNFPFWVWLFLTPFVLIGLYLIYTVGRQLLIWLTADETITEISQEPLQPGQSAELFMIQKGRKKVQTVQVKVTCQEKVTYRQGTDTRTEQATLYETIIYDQFDFTIDGSGWQQSIPFTIPDNAMHSFKFDNNELSWQIEFELKVAKAPDFSLVFPFRVVPPGVTLE